MPCGFCLLLFSSPNLSGHRLDVYHTSTHGVALVRVSNAGLKCAACGSLQIQDAKSRQKSPSGHHRTTSTGYTFATKATVHTNKCRPTHIRDVNETLAFETETRPRPRPCKAETETFFETFNLQHCAKTMNVEPASLDATNSSVTATATAVFIIMKFIHHISIKT